MKGVGKEKKRSRKRPFENSLRVNVSKFTVSKGHLKMDKIVGCTVKKSDRN